MWFQSFKGKADFFQSKNRIPQEECLLANVVVFLKI